MPAFFPILATKYSEQPLTNLRATFAKRLTIFWTISWASRRKGITFPVRAKTFCPHQANLSQRQTRPTQNQEQWGSTVGKISQATAAGPELVNRAAKAQSILVNPLMRRRAIHKSPHQENRRSRRLHMEIHRSPSQKDPCLGFRSQ